MADTAGEAAEIRANFLSAQAEKTIAANMRANRAGTGVSLDEWAARLERGQLQFAGTPDVLVERIRDFHAETGVGVLDFIFGSGSMAPAAVRRSTELFGQEVLPRIRTIGESRPTLAGSAAGQARV